MSQRFQVSGFLLTSVALHTYIFSVYEVMELGVRGIVIDIRGLLETGATAGGGICLVVLSETF